MTAAPSPPDPERLTRAHVVPFVVFMGFLILLQLIGGLIEWKHPDAPWWRQDPAQFIYPVQTLVTLGVLIKYWRVYTFDWSVKWSVIGIVCGAIGISFWLLPTALYDVWGLTGKTTGLLHFLGVAERKDGFDPGLFQNPLAYWTSLVLRFLRATVVVALVEEIFWRGFLMRFVMDWEGDWWKQPFGRPAWRSFGLVTALFVAEHSAADRPAALIYGAMTYLLCVKTKSLGACIIMHATANFLMCLFIMAYGKFGLW